jgi:transcriptional regulator with XRE-family HTH domain
MTVYERIKARRKEIGMTAEDVAEALGISRATVYRYESAEIEKVPINIIQDLAKVLRTTPEYLMGWENKNKAYYLSPETAEAAQAIFQDPNMRLLFDAARDSRPEDLQMTADLLKRLKATNPQG